MDTVDSFTVHCRGLGHHRGVGRCPRVPAGPVPPSRTLLPPVTETDRVATGRVLGFRTPVTPLRPSSTGFRVTPTSVPPETVVRKGLFPYYLRPVFTQTRDPGVQCKDLPVRVRTLRTESGVGEGVVVHRTKDLGVDPPTTSETGPGRE